ncbi:MAG: hypothetical protein Q8K55_03325 [Gemmatimonadaceae bacterium]|nr:hypothetical protein [Gemmatimonadaceae bacterium]
MPRHWIGRLACAVLVITAAAPAVRAQGAAAPSWTRITYISGATIYLEVGSKQGLTEQTSLDVVRGGAAIARLRVTALSSNRAACEALPSPVELVVGDSVRYIASAVPTAPVTASPTSSKRTTSRATAPVLRGRFGMRYLVISPDGDAAGGLTQPAYDVRLDGQRLVGTGFGLAVDARAQRTQYAAAGTQAARPSVNTTRVYQAAVSWSAPRAGLRFSAGRQLAGALSSVGLFDGLAIDLDRRRWSVGGFAGSQPDPFSFGVSGRVREYGAYGQIQSATTARRATALTVGGVGSYVAGAIDREYAFARLTTSGPTYSVYATQELDVNRGWKRTAEHTATTPTATFVSVQFTPTRAISLSGGFDNRRSVRLYRDYQNPELAFDDAFREGTWAGVSLVAPRYARLSIDRRDSRGGLNGESGSTTIMGSVSGYTRYHLGLRARGTAFSGSLATGQLLSAALEVDPWEFLRLEANGGSRTSTSRGAATSARMTWYGVDADIGIGRSLYILLSSYRERESGAGSMQTYASISWRF